MALVAVDPGLRNCGVAVFEGGRLVSAWLARSPNKTDRFPVAWNAMAYEVSKGLVFREITELVIEVPQVYRFLKVDPADLIEIAGVVGAVSAALDTTAWTGYYPRQWKGSVPKEVHGPRVLAKLTPDEVDAIQPCPASLRHNVVDAIGLGLFRLGR